MGSEMCIRDSRDILGRVNQAVAARADRVYILVAGYALDVKSLGVPIANANLDPR